MQLTTRTDGKEWPMHIGLKYQGMELVTMMFGKSIPIIGFLIREGTVELFRVQLVRDTTENNLIEIMGRNI